MLAHCARYGCANPCTSPPPAMTCNGASPVTATTLWQPSMRLTPATPAMRTSRERDPRDHRTVFMLQLREGDGPARPAITAGYVNDSRYDHARDDGPRAVPHPSYSTTERQRLSNDAP